MTIDERIESTLPTLQLHLSEMVADSQVMNVTLTSAGNNMAEAMQGLLFLLEQRQKLSVEKT